jgi:hypothetical protein
LKKFATAVEDVIMNPKNSIKLFEEKTVRTHWDAKQDKWFFSIVDVVGVLTGQTTPRGASNYWAKLKERLLAEGANELLTNCQQLKMTAADGKQRLTDVADTEQLFRLIQSIPSPKAESLKLWLAQVGRQRIDETADPELSIDRALETYLKKGYSTNWINQRLKTIEVRKELTDEWEKRGIADRRDFAILTDEITQAWSGKTIRQYKALKDLKNENLRDNMANVELVLNMLAEITTTDISRQDEPETMSEHKNVARRGGSVAKVARVQYEKQTGKKAVTSLNAKNLIGITSKKQKNEDQ